MCAEKVCLQPTVVLGSVIFFCIVVLFIVSSLSQFLLDLLLNFHLRLLNCTRASPTFYNHFSISFFALFRIRILFKS